MVLIPKIKEPKDMTHFRPICLYHVIYKIVFKVLANRLKVLLLGCFSQNQSAFVSGADDSQQHSYCLGAHRLSSDL